MLYLQGAFAKTVQLARASAGAAIYFEHSDRAIIAKLKVVIVLPEAPGHFATAHLACVSLDRACIVVNWVETLIAGTGDFGRQITEIVLLFEKFSKMLNIHGRCSIIFSIT
jgi:hypothetical protein